MGETNLKEARFWTRVAKEANSDAMAVKARELKCVRVMLGVGSSVHAVEFHRGRVAVPPSGPAEAHHVSISGPENEWERLIRGEIVYAQAINIHHGRLRLQGDAVIAAWATPALWEFFRVAASTWRESHQHG